MDKESFHEQSKNKTNKSKKENWNAEKQLKEIDKFV